MRRYLRPFLPDFFVRSVRNVLKYCLRLAPGPREIRPDRGDLLLVLGAAWTKPDLLCKLTRLKQARGCGMISLVYDLLPLYHPHLFGTGGPAFRERFRKYITALVSGSDGIAAISEATSRDIERFCRESGIACSPVHVFRLGDDYDERIPGPPPGGLKPGGYILIVGTIEMRKNPLLVYQMVKQASMEGISLPPVVLVGRPGSEFEIIRRLTQEDPEVRGRIRLLASMDDAGLNRLYRNCLFTIYPSMCEGWGLPIAESLCHGKICIASRTSSMPEIAGDLIEYASPYDPGEFLDLVRKYLVPTVREKKEKEIAARYRPHGWDEAFSRFDAIVRKVIKASSGEP
jgi:hypothetical protein